MSYRKNPIKAATPMDVRGLGPAGSGIVRQGGETSGGNATRDGVLKTDGKTGEAATKDGGGPRADDNTPGNAGIPAGDKPNPDPTLWRSRGYLPHFDKADVVQSITFRLHDSVPEAVVHQRKAELDWLEQLPESDPRAVDLREFIDKYEDAGHGACWLRNPIIAAIVEGALLHFDQERYRLIAWCVMPNHVHALVVILAGHPLDKVVHSWKSFTASEANRSLGRAGRFWFREYHDRFIRDLNHLRKAIDYIETNPVTAGLVAQVEDWRFGSAAKGRGWWTPPEFATLLGEPPPPGMVAVPGRAATLLGTPASLPATDHGSKGNCLEGKGKPTPPRMVAVPRGVP